MSYLINLVDDVQPNKLFAEEWLNKIVQHILERMKINLVKSTYIHNFQKQKLDLNGCKTVIEFVCFYQSILKIFVSVEFTFMIHFQTHIKYNISSPHHKIMSTFPLLKKSIKQLKYLQRESKGLFKFSNIDGIMVQQKDNFYPAPEQFHSLVQQIFQKIIQPYSICQSILKELQFISQSAHVSTSKQRNRNHLKTFENLGMIERENKMYRQFYRNQNMGRSQLKNPAEIKNKNHQILRNVEFYQKSTPKQKPMNKNVNPRFQGSFSSLTLIESYGAIINTFHQQRQQPRQKEALVDYKPGRTEGKFKLICKRVGGNQSVRHSAQKSLQNQIQYLKLKGNFHVPYVCNYYFKFIHSSELPDRRQVGRQTPKQIYSDYHDYSIWDMFYQGRCFTLLDVINFGEQLMIGLIGFYLNLDYLHRDVKELNILVSSEGVIQIIDNGSVYQFKKQITNNIMNQEKKKFDSQVRSTLWVNKQTFNLDSHLIGKYKSWTNYKSVSATHRTFDVYSVGFMLSEILVDYQLFSLTKWMEVSQRLKKLTDKMTQKDFEYRIQMEKALVELQNIRKFIFQQPAN